MAKQLMEAVQQGWKWLVGGAPAPDRRSWTVLGGVAAVLAVVVIGLSAVSGHPTASAPASAVGGTQAAQTNPVSPPTTAPGGQSAATLPAVPKVTTPTTTAKPTTTTTPAKPAVPTQAAASTTKKAPGKKTHSRKKGPVHRKHVRPRH